MGCGEGVDIQVEGTGVEPRHCIVENEAGVVTLTPLASMTSVDGVPVAASTRLMQGSMLCVGRSNFYRFNHPAEARLMRSLLPNSRISVLQPLPNSGVLDNPEYYHQSVNPGSLPPMLIGLTKPPAVPARNSRPSPRIGDPWAGVEDSVFHADTVTVNSPASAVLGPRAASSPSPLLGPTTTSYLQRSTSPSPLLGTSQSPAHRRTLSAGSSSGGSSQRLAQTGRSSPMLVRSPPILGAPSCSPAPSLRSSAHGGSSCSLEELVARGEELEAKRKQAQEARMREQEAQRQERARLEEILTMCAEYERQAQLEKQQTQQQQPAATSSAGTNTSSPPPHQTTAQQQQTTTLVHQNRIKTNGSLPRDKRLPSPSGQSRLQAPASPLEPPATSPVAPRGTTNSNNRSLTASEDELSQIFTFETSPTLMAAATASAAPRMEPSGPSPQPRSPYENVATSTSPSYLTYPQSPRTRIRTIAASKKDVVDENNPPPKPPLPSPRLISVAEVMANASSVDSPHLPVLKALEAQHRANSSDRFIRPLGTSDGNLESHLRPVGGSLPTSPAPHTPSSVDSQTRRRSMEEAEQMRRERSRVLSTMSSIKRKVAEIQLHEEEVVRELEMERALLDGEWQAQGEKLVQEEERLLTLQMRLEHLDRDVTTARLFEARHLGDCRARLEAGEDEARRLEQELMLSRGSMEHQRELSEQLRHQQEVLEVERKQEAMWEAGREELTRELAELSSRIKARQIRLLELQNQRREATEAAMNETHLVERQLDTPLRKLAEGRNRLREIESQLQEMARQGLIISHDSSPDGSSDADESSPQLSLSPQRLQTTSQQEQQEQQELGERISRVTAKAPMDMRNGSLGRKTIQSLKEIEKNRQLLLAKQGREVIEEERKRVQALKRRVQDEVRAQWEERRQREANCNSLNSVGSEDASSDDAGEKLKRRGSSGKSAGPRNNAPAASPDPSPGPADTPSPVSSEEGKSGSSSGIPLSEQRKQGVHLVVNQRENGRGHHHRGCWGKARQSLGAGRSRSTMSLVWMNYVRNQCRQRSPHRKSNLWQQQQQADVQSLFGAHLFVFCCSVVWCSLLSYLCDICARVGRPRMFGDPRVLYLQQQVRQHEEQQERDREETRPLSDASSYDDQLSVRLRDPKLSRLQQQQQQRPLTRYLPIRSEALDLRAHIESAGHQVELCTHVLLDATSCRGFLHKMGSKFRNWNRRWFVFDRSRRCLTYYTDRNEKKARGGVYFQSIEEVYVDHLNSVKSPNPQLTFCVKASERTYHLMAPSAEAMRIWVDVVFTGAEGYQEFEPGS
ncbi:hypothetical protein B566_EDAN011000 [Ephemera danica]|nr:hypothetical protein B566_EDAN011000 [Ephemera danica]